MANVWGKLVSAELLTSTDFYFCNHKINYENGENTTFSRPFEGIKCHLHYLHDKGHKLHEILVIFSGGNSKTRVTPWPIPAA